MEISDEGITNINLSLEHSRKRVLPSGGFSPLDRECRICLRSEIEPDNTLVCPCNCSGSLAHIHESCLQKWIDMKTSAIHASEMRTLSLVQCEICHLGVPVSPRDTYDCQSCEQISKSIRRNRGLFLVCIIGMFSSICALVYCSMLFARYSSGENQFSSLPITQQSVTIASFLLALGFLILSLYNLLNFFLKSTIRTFSYSKQRANEKKKSRVEIQNS